VAQMAAAGKVDPKVLGKRLRQSGRIESLKEQMLRDKAADFIAANAVAVAPEVEPAEPAEAEAAESAPQSVPAEAEAAAAAPAEAEAAESAGDTAAEDS